VRMKSSLLLVGFLAFAACAHVATPATFINYDEARAARLASRVKENVRCPGDEQARLRIACTARAVETPQPFVAPTLPVSLLGVTVSVPETGPFRVRDGFALPVLTIGRRGATLTFLLPENDLELRETEELTGQLYELFGGQRQAPLSLPSDVAVELQRTTMRAPSEIGFTRHSTFAEFGDDARIFYFESFAGHPAYAVLVQSQTEIQLSVFPMVPTRTLNPEFASYVPSPSRSRTR
jgi:hypothetical protein